MDGRDEIYSIQYFDVIPFTSYTCRIPAHDGGGQLPLTSVAPRWYWGCSAILVLKVLVEAI